MDRLTEAAVATENPFLLSYALFADGTAIGDTDPARALEAYRRGLLVAQDSGNRFMESSIAYSLGRLEVTHGEMASAFANLSLAIRNMLDSGNSTTMRIPLALLATALDRLGFSEAAATTVGFTCSPLAEMMYPEITAVIARLRVILGDENYEWLARRGETITTAEMVAYAYD